MSIRAVKTFLLGFVFSVFFLTGPFAVEAGGMGKKGDEKTKRPNILLIIGDDIGIDVTSKMYPGLIEASANSMGIRHNHPDTK